MHQSGLGEHFVRRTLARRISLPDTNAVLKKWLKQQQLPHFSWYFSTSENQPEVHRKTEKPNKVPQLSFADLQSVYVLGGLGVCFSTFIFVTEFLIFLFNEKRKKLNKY